MNESMTSSPACYILQPTYVAIRSDITQNLSGWGWGVKNIFVSEKFNWRSRTTSTGLTSIDWVEILSLVFVLSINDFEIF